MADRKEKILKMKRLLMQRALSDRGKAEKERTTKTEAFLTGAAQGGTLGTADEIKAFFRSVSDPKGPLAESLQELKAIGKGEELPERTTSVGKFLEEEQAKVQRARVEQPGAFFAGDIAGGLAVSALPGAGLAKFGTTAKGLIGTGAAVGGISGAARADEDRLAGALLGATLGAGTGVLGSALGATIKKGGQLVERAAKGGFGKKAKDKAVTNAAKDLDRQLRKGTEAEKTFAKNLKDDLDKFTQERELRDTILKEQVKDISITDRLKETFKMPSTPLGVVKDLGQLGIAGPAGFVAGRAAKAVAPELLRRQEQLRAGGRAVFPGLVGQEPNLFELRRR